MGPRGGRGPAGGTWNLGGGRNPYGGGGDLGELEKVADHPAAEDTLENSPRRLPQEGTRVQESPCRCSVARAPQAQIVIHLYDISTSTMRLDEIDDTSAIEHLKGGMDAINKIFNTALFGNKFAI